MHDITIGQEYNYSVYYNDGNVGGAVLDNFDI